MQKESNPYWAPQSAVCDNCGTEFDDFLSVFPNKDWKTVTNGSKVLYLFIYFLFICRQDI